MAILISLTDTFTTEDDSILDLRADASFDIPECAVYGSVFTRFHEAHCRERASMILE